MLGRLCNYLCATNLVLNIVGVSKYSQSVHIQETAHYLSGVISADLMSASTTIRV